MTGRLPKAFTLVEIMIVISLIGAFSYYSIQLYSGNLTDSLTDAAATRVANIKRAVNNYYINHGAWPDADNKCADAAELLQPIIGMVSKNPWGFDYEMSCSEINIEPNEITAETDDAGTSAVPLEQLKAYPSFIIRQEVENLKVAKQLRGRLPSSDIIEEEGRLYVETYIPMVVIPALDDTSKDVQIINGQVSFLPLTCPTGMSLEIAIFPKRICDVNYRFRGYRAGVRKAGENSLNVNVYYEFQNQDGNWVDGFAICGVGVAQYNDLLSIHQFCKSG